MKNLEIIGIGDNLGAGMPQKKAKKGTAKRRKTWTFDPPPDLREKIELAIAATGADRTELLIECVREDLSAVVARILAEREQAAAKFRTAHGEGNKK